MSTGCLAPLAPYGYSRQPVLLLHLIFLFFVILSYKCKSTFKVVVVVVKMIVNRCKTQVKSYIHFLFFFRSNPTEIKNVIN